MHCSHYPFSFVLQIRMYVCINTTHTHTHMINAKNKKVRESVDGLMVILHILPAKNLNNTYIYTVYILN